MLSTSDQLSPELAVCLLLSRRIPSSLWLDFPCSHRLPFLALSLRVQILTVPGVGVLACGEYAHVELRSAGSLVFFLCGTHWTRHLTQALRRLGKCPPLSYSPRPRPCAGWAMPPLSYIRRSRGLLRKKICVSVVCMNVCCCIVCLCGGLRLILGASFLSTVQLTY